VCKCFFLNPRVQRDGLRVQTPQRRALRSQEKTQDIKNEYHKVLTRRDGFLHASDGLVVHTRQSGEKKKPEDEDSRPGAVLHAPDGPVVTPDVLGRRKFQRSRPSI